jgi:hypothetical protein
MLWSGPGPELMPERMPEYMYVRENARKIARCMSERMLE